MKILVGNQPITVRGLGRMFFAGNIGVQTVKVVRVADSAEVANVEVNMSGGVPGQFKYAHLATPAVLAANTAYYVVSLEVFGGNLWADYFGTVLTANNVATVPAAVYRPNGSGWTEVLGANRSYVPADLLYVEGTNSTPSNPSSGTEQALVSNATLGRVRNDFTGQVGMKVALGNQPITVTGLGRMFFAGNSGVQTVRIVRVNDLTEVASVGINMNGGVPGQFNYGSLGSPVVLAANTTYYLVSLEASGGNQWADYEGTLLTLNNVATAQAAVYIGSGFGWTEVAGANRSYGPLNLHYLDGTTGPAGPTTVNIAVSANPSGGGTVSGGGVYSSGALVAVSAVTSAGSAFANWSENGSVVSSLANYQFTATGNRTLVANFTSNVSGGSGAHEYITGLTLGALRSEGGVAGFQFTVGPNPIQISALARLCAPGNSRSHELKLVQNNGTDLAGGSVTVSMAGRPAGQFVWGNLAVPVVLQANTTYRLVSSEGWYLDAWYDGTTGVSTTAAAQCDGAGYVWYGWSFQGGQNTARGPLNFRYQETGAGGSAASPNVEVQLEMERDQASHLYLHVRGQMGTTIRLESTDDFVNWTPFQQITLSAEAIRLEISLEHPRRFWRATAP